MNMITLIITRILIISLMPTRVRVFIRICLHCTFTSNSIYLVISVAALILALVLLSTLIVAFTLTYCYSCTYVYTYTVTHTRT